MNGARAVDDGPGIAGGEVSARPAACKDMEP